MRLFPTLSASGQVRVRVGVRVGVKPSDLCMASMIRVRLRQGSGSDNGQTKTADRPGRGIDCI